MSVRQPKLDPLKPLDYAALFGLPALFLLIVVLSVRSFLGPPSPNKDAVQLLRGGAVTSGMYRQDVLSKVGSPNAEITNPDGTITFRYMKSRWNADGSGFIEEDAYVDFDGNERVRRVEFDSRTPPISGTTSAGT